MDLNLTQTLENLLNTLGGQLPGVLGAILVLIIGWIVAGIISRIVYRLLKKTKWDDKLMSKAQLDIDSNKLISKLVYYLLMIIVLMVVLEMMGVSNVLDPLKNMVGDFTGFFAQNLLPAGIIAFAGYILAKIVSSLIKFSGGFLSKVANKIGVAKTGQVINIISQVVFIIIFGMMLIAALDVLGIEAISTPAKGMIETFISAIPKIFLCAVIIGAFYIGGKYFSGVLKNLLFSIGTDDAVEKLHLGSMIGERSLSSIIANTLFVFVVLFGVITGVEKLEFESLTNILNIILGMTSKILFGLIILTIGNFISLTVYNIINKGENNQLVANIARYASLFLFIFLGLSEMGVGKEIVNLGFGLTLGSVAVVVALAYGLGGREAAGKHMGEILASFKKK
jgi:hypothetical protein